MTPKALRDVSPPTAEACFSTFSKNQINESVPAGGGQAIWKSVQSFLVPPTVPVSQGHPAPSSQGTLEAVNRVGGRNYSQTPRSAGSRNARWSTGAGRAQWPTPLDRAVTNHPRGHRHRPGAPSSPRTSRSHGARCNHAVGPAGPQGLSRQSAHSAK